MRTFFYAVMFSFLLFLRAIFTIPEKILKLLYLAMLSATHTTDTQLIWIVKKADDFRYNKWEKK